MTHKILAKLLNKCSQYLRLFDVIDAVYTSYKVRRTLNRVFFSSIKVQLSNMMQFHMKTLGSLFQKTDFNVFSMVKCLLKSKKNSAFVFETRVIILECLCFYFKVYLRNNFPEQQPLLTLHSIYHVNHSRLPYKQVIQDYSYNSQWSVDENIEKLQDDLVVFIDSFKESSKKCGRKDQTHNH